MKSLLPLLIATLLVHTADAQDSRPADAPNGGPAPVAASADQEKAKEILRRGILAQSPDAKVPDVSSFEGNCQFQLFEYDESGRKRSTTSGDISQMWSKAPTGVKAERTAYRRTMSTDVTAGGTMIVDYDDIVWRPNAKTGATEYLTSKDYKADRDRLRGERRRFAQILRLFFLANLDVDSKDLALEGEGIELSFTIGAHRLKHTTDAVRTRDGDKNDLTLWFDKTTHQLVRAKVAYAGDKGIIEEFHLGNHQSVGIGAAGSTITLPLWIQYLEAGRVILNVTAQVPENFRFNALTDEQRRNLFIAPE